MVCGLEGGGNLQLLGVPLVISDIKKAKFAMLSNYLLSIARSEVGMFATVVFVSAMCTDLRSKLVHDLSQVTHKIEFSTNCLDDLSSNITSFPSKSC